MDDKPGHRRWWEWWQTVPGILTAAAGIITAVAGLIVALHQAGFFERGNRSADTVNLTKNESSRPPESKTAEKPAAPGKFHDLTKESSSDHVKPSGSISLPPNAEVRVRNGEVIYKILSAHLEPHSLGKLSLIFEVRLTNNSGYLAALQASALRLLIDGILRAPERGVDEFVESHSAKEGTVAFAAPDNVTEVELQIAEVGEGKPAIPISLKP
jgi:hypothetical protein